MEREVEEEKWDGEEKGSGRKSENTRVREFGRGDGKGDEGVRGRRHERNEDERGKNGGGDKRERKKTSREGKMAGKGDEGREKE